MSEDKRTKKSRYTQRKQRTTDNTNTVTNEDNNEHEIHLSKRIAAKENVRKNKRRFQYN